MLRGMSMYDDLQRLHQSRREGRDRSVRGAEMRQLSLEVDKVDVVPMPRTETRPFRSSVPVEALPVFVSGRYKGKSWSYERIVGEGRNEKLQRTTVAGVLTSLHQRCWYHVLEAWGEQGYPLILDGERARGKVEMAPYELVKRVRGDDAAHHYKIVRRLLRELSAVAIVREEFYGGVKDEVEFTLLGEVEWRGRKLDPQTNTPQVGGSSKVTVLLSSFVTESFLSRKMKALMLAPYLAVGKSGGRGGELAPLLYSRLDYQLSGKREYHRRATTLLEELGCRSYKYRSERKRKLKPAVDLLNGQPILRAEYTLRVALELAKDGSDWLLKASKEPRKQLGLRY